MSTYSPQNNYPIKELIAILLILAGIIILNTCN